MGNRCLGGCGKSIALFQFNQPLKCLAIVCASVCVCVTSHAKELRDGLHPFALHSLGIHTTPGYLGHLWSLLPGSVWLGLRWSGPYPQPISAVYLTFPPDSGLDLTPLHFYLSSSANWLRSLFFIHLCLPLFVFAFVCEFN